MKNETIISAIGILWLTLSASHIPHLIYYYPFHELKGVKSLAEEVANAPEFIKEAAGIGDKTQKELEESVTSELRITWVKSLLLVLVGFLVSVFMLRKKKLGRTIALFLASGLLLVRIIYFLKHWDTQTSSRFWTLFFEYYPVQTIQNIASIVLLIVTIFLLLRPSITAQFRWLRTET